MLYFMTCFPVLQSLQFLNENVSISVSPIPVFFFCPMLKTITGTERYTKGFKINPFINSF